MKALVCELCGSNNIIKQDGFFVCQNCGTKYSTEEAKKMMIEGTVDVSGSTVKVDKSDELRNLYKIARRAKNENNEENAQKYYEQILLKDSNSWEAASYSVYFQSMQCKISEIESAANRLTNCEETVLLLVKKNIIEKKEQKETVTEISERIIQITESLYQAALQSYANLRFEEQYKPDFVKRSIAARNIAYHFGDKVIEIFGEAFGRDIAVPCWKEGIVIHKSIISNFTDRDANENQIISYAKKIQKYDQYYPTPVFNSPQKSGCYVATEVYGSYDCPQVWTLRRYRDNTLAKTWHGRAFIHTYYAVSPTLVKWFGNTEWFRMMWKPKLDKMVANLNAQGVEDTPYSDLDW